MEILKGILIESWNLLYEMSPYLLLGFIFAGILHVFVSIETIGKHLGKKGFWSVIKSVIFGIPLPLCSCGVIPAAVLLRRNGASRGSVISFLIATPITGVDSIFATYALFGLIFSIFRVIASSITAVIAGLVANLLPYGESDGHLTKEESDACPHCAGNIEEDRRGSSGLTTKKRFADFLNYAFIKSVGDIWKWLVIGTLIGGTISHLVPVSFIGENVSSPFLTMIIMLIVGIPMYVCSTGSIPIAAALMMKGISPGAALVFLLAGPATNAVTITVVAKEIGKRATFIYVFVIAVMSLAMGALLDYIPGRFISMTAMSSHEHSGILPGWLYLLSTIVMVLMIIVAIVKDIVKRSINGSKKEKH